MGPDASALETAILVLLDAGAAGATISPNDAVLGDPALEQAARAAARRLAAAGEVEIVVGGVVVDPSTARGAMRIRRVR